MSGVQTDNELLAMGQFTLAGEQFFAHDGVKGMRWGVRKAQPLAGPRRPSAAPVDNSERNRKIAKAAIAIGAVAVTAILLKRGGIKLSTPASRKIALSGAKTSLNIIKKSGNLAGKVSVKVGGTVGRGAVSGTAKAGSLIGKVGKNATVATSKAVARVTAQNGSRFYERVLKRGAMGTAKYGSNLMFKYTGRGTPIVREAAARSYNFNPADLLLNVRADPRLFRR